MNIVNLNFNRISSKRSDVLIIDKSGSEYISKCIPSNLSINILNVREGIPFIAKLSFLLFLFKRIFQFQLTQVNLNLQMHHIRPDILSLDHSNLSYNNSY